MRVVEGGWLTYRIGFVEVTHVCFCNNRVLDFMMYWAIPDV